MERSGDLEFERDFSLDRLPPESVLRGEEYIWVAGGKVNVVSPYHDRWELWRGKYFRDATNHFWGRTPRDVKD